MNLCVSCYRCEKHCQCTYPQWKEKVNYECEECVNAKADGELNERIKELEDQLAAAHEEIRLNQTAASKRISDLESQLQGALMKITQLQSLLD